MGWKSKKDGTHYNTDKKVRDVSDDDVIIENNISLESAEDLESFARDKAEEFCRVYHDRIEAKYFSIILIPKENACRFFLN